MFYFPAHYASLYHYLCLLWKGIFTSLLPTGQLLVVPQPSQLACLPGKFHPCLQVEIHMLFPTLTQYLPCTCILLKCDTLEFYQPRYWPFLLDMEPMGQCAYSLSCAWCLPESWSNKLSKFTLLLSLK